MSNLNISNKRIKLNNNLSKPAKQVVSSNENGSAVSFPPPNAVLLGRKKLLNSPTTQSYREKKREWFESQDQSLKSKAEIGRTFFLEITNKYKWQFWKHEAGEWRMLNDSEALQKVKRDVRMMTKTTEPDVEHTLPYFLPYFVDSVDEPESLSLPVEITLWPSYLSPMFRI